MFTSKLWVLLSTLLFIINFTTPSPNIVEERQTLLIHGIPRSTSNESDSVIIKCALVTDSFISILQSEISSEV
ncbi:hypothetical protein AYI69_g5063, partial [Smittium culicis]